MKFVLLAVWSAAAGALIPGMAVLNARMGRSLEMPTVAPVLMFAVAFAAALAVHLTCCARWPTNEQIQKLHPIDLAGGLIVAFYVVSVTLLVPRFGVGNTIMLVMVAQILTSAMIDHFGLFGAAVLPLSPGRTAGLLILLIGLAMTQLFSQKSSM